MVPIPTLPKKVDTPVTVRSVNVDVVLVLIPVTVTIPVKDEPSPTNFVAQKIPPEFIALMVDPAKHTLKELSPIIQRLLLSPIAS